MKPDTSAEDLANLAHELWEESSEEQSTQPYRGLAAVLWEEYERIQATLTSAAAFTGFDGIPAVQNSENVVGRPQD